MMRKSIVALAAIAILGTATIPMTSAQTRRDMSNRAAFSNNQGTFNNRASFNNRANFHNNRAGFNNRFVARNNFGIRDNKFRFRNHNRFAFRHHFRPGFGGAFASCSIVRRTWTPWGWRWHRVWVC